LGVVVGAGFSGPGEVVQPEKTGQRPDGRTCRGGRPWLGGGKGLGWAGTSSAAEEDDPRPLRSVRHRACGLPVRRHGGCLHCRHAGLPGRCSRCPDTGHRTGPAAS
jgi:hypothetical protein